MESIKNVYKRFKDNYRTNTGGINLYPQFDYDLEELLEWIEAENDWSFADVDCSWRPPEGECDAD